MLISVHAGYQKVKWIVDISTDLSAKDAREAQLALLYCFNLSSFAVVASVPRITAMSRSQFLALSAVLSLLTVTSAIPSVSSVGSDLQILLHNDLYGNNPL